MTYDPRVDSSPAAPNYWADPDAPDGSDEAAGFLADSTLILIVEPRREHGAAKDAPTFEVCFCGCEELKTNQKAKTSFLQGHDQRLIGKLIRAGRDGVEVALVGGGVITSGSADIMAAHLLGDNGVAKVHAGISREAKPRKSRAKTSPAEAAAKAAAKPVEVEPEPEAVHGSVKVGRWQYPAVRYSDGSVERNTKRDGSGEWVMAEASQFAA